MPSSSIFGIILLRICWIILNSSHTVGQSNVLISETLPEPPYCGLMLADRHYNVRETNIDEHPWTALLSYNSPDEVQSDSGYTCVGSLINARWVVTAAHCVTGFRRDWQLSSVRLGEWNTATNPDCVGLNDCAPPHIDVRVDSIFVHPDYKLGQPEMGADIALLRLAHAVAPTIFVKPVCLMRSPELRNRTMVGTPVISVFWDRLNGQSLVKVKATLTVVSADNCERALKEFKFIPQNNQICAGNAVGNDTCNIDSGGPLLVEFKVGPYTAFYLGGIASIGSPDCTGNNLAAFSRVSSFIDWIEETISVHGNAKVSWFG